MNTYVWHRRGYEAQVIVVKADNEDEAYGKATRVNHGVAPTGDPELLDEILEDEGGAVKLA